MLADSLTQAQLHCVRLTSYSKQETSLVDFALDKKTILVTTDAASAGIEREHLRCIVNYDFPESLEHYCQRLSRLSHEGSFCSLFTRASASMAKNVISILERAKARVDPCLHEFARVAA